MTANSEPIVDHGAEFQMTGPHGLGPGQTLVALQPVPTPGVADSVRTSLRLKGLLGALRRRWFVAASLGLLLGGAAAAGVWYSLPDSYTAFAEIMINPDDRFIYSERETREQSEPLETYKQTNMRLATYPFVLTAALRPEDSDEERKVHQCRTLQDVEDPVQWLADHIKVTSPGKQFLRVSLEGEHPNDLALIVNAVVEAFRKEVLDKDQFKRKEELDELSRQLASAETEYNRQATALMRLKKELDAANDEQANLQYQSLILENAELWKQLGPIEWEIMQTEFELKMLQTAKDAAAAGENDATAESIIPTDEDAGPPLNRSTASQNSPPILVVPPMPIEIEIPEAVIEGKLAEDAAYLQMQERLALAEIQLNLNHKRYEDGHSQIRKCEEQVQQWEAEIERYRQEHVPQIREPLVAELRAKLATPVDELPSATPRDDEIPTPPLQEPQVNTIAMLNDKLVWQTAMKKTIADRLEKNQLAQRDLGNQWVEHDIQKEAVDVLRSQVRFYESTYHNRKVEFDHEADNPRFKIEPAEVPTKPDRAKRIKMAGAAGFGIFGLLVGGIIFLEYSARRLNSVNEVQTDLNLQVMSTIPMMPRWVDSDIDPSQSHKAAYWHGVLTESVDASRTMLLRHAQIHSTKVVMIVSAVGSEGKTTLCCHLATSLARSGRRVLLIDGDMRRPSVHKVYDMEKAPGLCELLTDDQLTLVDVVHPLSPEGLFAVSAGKVTSATLQALAQDDLSRILNAARSEYDFVIIDTSPVLPITDTLLMSQFADGVLFSIRKDVSRATKVAAAVQRLTMLGVNVLGAVAIGLDEGSMASNYPYSGYGYGYGYGYGVNPHASPRSSSSTHR